jgi:AmmeMemoRadiSam system protein B
MSHVRQPAVSGRFYPANPTTLRATIGRYLESARESGAVPKALIVPHAGYDCSGPIAASAYAALARKREMIRRAVLLGPAHRLMFDGLAASAAEAFRTPLGSVPVDQLAVERALELPQVHLLDAAHCDEHCLEVQLPFLQMVLPEFQVVPFLVGNAMPHEVGQVLDLLWGGDETLIVVSSDLSHDHECDEARKLDRSAAQAIESLDPERLSSKQACGSIAIRGLLLAARKNGLAAQTLDLQNSSDTVGPRDQVVGYGAFAFGQPVARATVPGDPLK